MQGKAYGAIFGKTPIYGGGVSFEDSDISQILAAANDLTKTLVSTSSSIVEGIGYGIGLAAKGAIGICLGVLILEAIHQWIEEAKKPRFALGCSPIRIDAGGGVQWGVILDETFPFEFQGENLELPFSQIVNLGAGVVGKGPLNIQTIDKSFYNGVIAKKPVIQVVTLAGVRTIKLHHSPNQNYTSDSWSDKRMRDSGFNNLYDRFHLIPSQEKDVSELKTSLEFTLQNNKNQINKLIGEETLRKFFKL